MRLGMPFWTTGAMSSPCWSASTTWSRTRFGPVSPPLASEPWQKLQLLWKSCCPRASCSGGAGGRSG